MNTEITVKIINITGLFNKMVHFQFIEPIPDVNRTAIFTPYVNYTLKLNDFIKLIQPNSKLNFQLNHSTHSILLLKLQ